MRTYFVKVGDSPPLSGAGSSGSGASARRLPSSAEVCGTSSARGAHVVPPRLTREEQLSGGSVRVARGLTGDTPRTAKGPTSTRSTRLLRGAPS